VSLPRRKRAAQSYRVALLTFASLATLLSLLVVAIVEERAVGGTLRAALRDVSALNDDETRVAAELTLIPLLVGVVTYVLAAQGIRLLRLAVYLRALHRATGERLRRTSPLLRLGHLNTGADQRRVVPVDAQKGAHGKPTPLASAIARSSHTLLLGTAATGKTTALLGVAYEASRTRELFPTFFGRRTLPVLISLPQYAAASAGAYDKPNLAYLAEQIGAYSSPGFAARLSRSLRRQRILLLCDDLDETPEDEMARVLGHLSRLGARPYRRFRVLVTANSAARDTFMWRLEEKLGEKKEWRALELWPLRTKGSHPPPPTFPPHLLDAPQRLPVSLTAVAQAPAESALPYGIARLLAAQCHRQCEAIATEMIPAAYLLQFLGGLASALCAADVHALPLEPARSIGVSVGAWLDTYRPQAPARRRPSGGVGLAAEQITALCQMGIEAGLLVHLPGPATLRFTHRLIEASCAALWLIDHDEPGEPGEPGEPLDPRLLGEQWLLPLLFWSGLADRPERVAEGLLRLRDTSKSVALRAGLRRHEAQPTAIALALATILYGSAVQHTALQEITPTSTRALTHIETHLRAILDETLAAIATPPQADVISAAARHIWDYAGPELDSGLRALTSAPSFGRLTHAEIYTCLGLFASPAALTILIERLGEREPTIRTGVTRGLTLAGYAALPELQARITSGDEGARLHAAEIIDAIDASDAEGGTSAHRTVVHVLATGAPDERVAAAAALGALQAHPAVAPLIARLSDREPDVRAAAARALAKLGAPEALEPLRAALRHTTPEVRIAVAEALGAYQSDEVAPDLARLLDDHAPAVRAAAATALGVIPGAVAVEALTAHTNDPDPATQAVILSALRRLGQR
jgi:HEAT repeat protein